MNKQFAKLNKEKYENRSKSFHIATSQKHFPNDEIRMMKSGYDIHNTHVTLN